MLLERSEINVRAGDEEAFDRTMAERAGPLLERTAGVRSVSWGRGVESPSKFMLLVEWDDMVAHQAFTRHASFGELREMLFAHSVGGAMEHFEMRG